tara:strand:+ start:156 stop:698 length:543 start_codon:yes stop_codon:yes gene_type:complete
MNLIWDAVASRVVWKGRFPVVVDRLRARADGREFDYTYLDVSRGAVLLLALDEEHRAICVRQYRHPVGDVMVELPAGHLEMDENPEACARREFEEETGLKVQNVLSLGSFVPVPSLSGFRMHMFFGTELSVGSMGLDDMEILEVVRVPIEELRKQVIEGQHENVGLMSAVLLADQRGLLP